MRLAETPLNVLPGHAVSGAPSHLFRYVETDEARIEFIVARPVVRNGLRLVAVTALA